MFDPAGDIRRFHERFGIETSPCPSALTAELQDYRSGFLHEELREYHEAATAARLAIERNDDAETDRQLEKALDGLVDLVYVAIGTAIAFHGFDFEEAWRRVHAANMAKMRAPSAGDSLRASAYDVIKPRGWQPPDLRDLVSR